MSNISKEKLAELKVKLLEERRQIEDELGTVGQRDPRTPEDWIPSVPDYGDARSDPNDVADKIEEMGERAGIETALEGRLDNIKKALVAMDEGQYGVCLVGNKEHEIPMGRLEANPAATTCIEHAD